LKRHGKFLGRIFEIEKFLLVEAAAEDALLWKMLRAAAGLPDTLAAHAQEICEHAAGASALSINKFQ